MNNRRHVRSKETEEIGGVMWLELEKSAGEYDNKG